MARGNPWLRLRRHRSGPHRRKTHDTAAIWVAFFQESQQQSRGQDGDAFRASVREIIDASLRLPPMPGTDVAALPGTVEYRRELAWRDGGIPVVAEHRAVLEEVAAELGVAPPPWEGRPRL